MQQLTNNTTPLLYSLHTDNNQISSKKILNHFLKIQAKKNLKKQI